MLMQKKKKKITMENMFVRNEAKNAPIKEKYGEKKLARRRSMVKSSKALEKPWKMHKNRKSSKNYEKKPQNAIEILNMTIRRTELYRKQHESARRSTEFASFRCTVAHCEWRRTKCKQLSVYKLGPRHNNKQANILRCTAGDVKWPLKK